MRFLLPLCRLLLAMALFLAPCAPSAWSAPVELLPQSISPPDSAGPSLFADVDGDGLSDLLVIDCAEKKLLIYRQSHSGFSKNPDQTVALPPQTAWVAVADVDAYPGPELVMSTASGVFYSRQDRGAFESARRPLIETAQVFTNVDFPRLAVLPRTKAGTNDSMPVIFTDKAIVYQRTNDYRWAPEPAMPFTNQQTRWSIDRDIWHNSWTIGSNPGHSLRVLRSFQSKPDPSRESEKENSTIEKIAADLKKNTTASPVSFERIDINGDGREDLVIWQVSGLLESIKTDLYIFLRASDGRLPEQPSQVLHCRGLPIPVGSTTLWSPINLTVDGRCELLLLEFKTGFTTASGLIKSALSHGLDWALNVRPFHDGAFSHSPDATLPITMILPAEIITGWPIFLEGDFNGDGRPDLLVRRSETQWNIFTTTASEHWFTHEPTLTFTTSARGQIEIKDLNHDGLADVIWYDPNHGTISIYMSSAAKNRNP